MATTLDLMEYANDAAAQLAYETNAVYTSQYPTQSADYVKATSTFSANYYPYFATDPTKSLIGDWVGTTWVTNSITNQRFHIDLGSAKIVTKIYYENCHATGEITDRGAKNFTFWGSNEADAFAELTYGTDTDWTQIDTYSDKALTQSKTTFDEHSAANEADPKYLYVDNTVTYRYYAFKFADNWTGAYLAVRRIELQDLALQSYSEDTIKQQGTYSLKGVAKQTDSLNDTLTRTI